MTPRSRHSARDKAVLVVAVAKAERAGLSVREALMLLGLDQNRYYRWRSRLRAGDLSDRKPPGRSPKPPPTPAEEAVVMAQARAYPMLGYRRLAYQMANKGLAFLRPWQVYQILSRKELLRRARHPQVAVLVRPLAPDRPNQVWHLDLMYVRIEPLWFFLIDIVDGYSRLLVHWRLARTMATWEVTAVVQEALDRHALNQAALTIIHDSGTQFVSREWRSFVEGAGVRNIRTRVRHPQSNGLIERLHRTHRAEGPFGYDPGSYLGAIEAMSEHARFYNNDRPHAALQYLCPADVHYGDPAGLLASREAGMIDAERARAAYWWSHRQSAHPTLATPGTVAGASGGSPQSGRRTERRAPAPT